MRAHRPPVACCEKSLSQVSATCQKNRWRCKRQFQNSELESLFHHQQLYTAMIQGACLPQASCETGMETI